MPPARSVVCAALLAATCGVVAIQAQSVADSPNGWDTFAANVTIRRSHVQSDGSRLGADPPAVQYRWEQHLENGQWRTTMTLVDIDHPIVETRTGPEALANAPLVNRLDNDGEGARSRLLDSKGRLITPPTAGAGQRLWALGQGGDDHDAPSFDVSKTLSVPSIAEGQNWIDNVLPRLSDSPQRRAALQARYQASPRAVRALDQYLGTSNGAKLEVLADPISVLPVEVNVVDQGVLTQHTTISYAPTIDGRVYRQRVLVERVVPDSEGVRSVTDIQMSDVRLEQRRIQ
jgi:hypothetical protein